MLLGLFLFALGFLSKSKIRNLIAPQTMWICAGGLFFERERGFQQPAVVPGEYWQVFLGDVGYLKASKKLPFVAPGASVLLVVFDSI